MNENERTAVNQLKNIREVSAVKLKKIDKGSPDAKPLVYISNIKRADILLRMINELEAYRTIGTVEACKLSLEICKDMIERGIELDHIREYIKFEDNLVQRGYDIKRLLEMMDEIGTSEVTDMENLDQNDVKDATNFFTLCQLCIVEGNIHI